MKKLLFILILCQITIASDWKKVPVSTKNPVLSINKTFVESRRCFGACCNEEYESECITAGNPKQSISVVLDFKHNLARNNSPYKIEIVFYDRNDFKLEDRYVFAWENGHYEFNGWWTKRGYEVGESVVKYAMIRIVPSQSYHIRPKNTWLDDNYGGIIRCGGVWKNGLCEEKPRCGEAVRAGYLSHRDTSRYDSTTNTCMKLPNGARWKNNNTYTFSNEERIEWECEYGSIKEYDSWHRSYSCRTKTCYEKGGAEVNGICFMPGRNMERDLRPSHKTFHCKEGFYLEKKSRKAGYYGYYETHYSYTKNGSIDATDVNHYECVFLSPYKKSECRNANNCSINEY